MVFSLLGYRNLCRLLKGPHQINTYAKMDNLKSFSSKQIVTVNESVALAEELVSNAYKLSTSQWLRGRYDFKTLVDLAPEEIVHGPFAQIVRYVGQRNNTMLGSASYDFYKICFQDHAILAALKASPNLFLFPFCLYIVTHELIHIVRFSEFLQNFEAAPDERQQEEARVHGKTHQILQSIKIDGLAEVFRFYKKWHLPVDGFN